MAKCKSSKVLDDWQAGRSGTARRWLSVSTDDAEGITVKPFATEADLEDIAAAVSVPQAVPGNHPDLRGRGRR